MSMHKIPLTPAERAGLHAHGLQRGIGKPSQLADVFRQGVAWGLADERARGAAVARAWGETHGAEETVNARNASSKIARGIEGPNVRAKPGAVGDSA